MFFVKSVFSVSLLKQNIVIVPFKTVWLWSLHTVYVVHACVKKEVGRDTLNVCSKRFAPLAYRLDVPHGYTVFGFKNLFLSFSFLLPSVHSSCLQHCPALSHLFPSLFPFVNRDSLYCLVGPRLLG